MCSFTVKKKKMCKWFHYRFFNFPGNSGPIILRHPDEFLSLPCTGSLWGYSHRNIPCRVAAAEAFSSFSCLLLMFPQHYPDYFFSPDNFQTDWFPNLVPISPDQECDRDDEGEYCYYLCPASLAASGNLTMMSDDSISFLPASSQNLYVFFLYYAAQHWSATLLQLLRSFLS